jgi:hypothetical protein
MWSILALKLSLGRCVDLTGAARQETQRVRTFLEKSAIKTAVLVACRKWLLDDRLD